MSGQSVRTLRMDCPKPDRTDTGPPLGAVRPLSGRPVAVRSEPAVRPAGRTLTLRGGVEVSVTALRLAWRLEEARVPFVLHDAGHLRPIPPTLIPGADRRAVSTHWAALARLVHRCHELSPEARR